MLYSVFSVRRMLLTHVYPKSRTFVVSHALPMKHKPEDKELPLSAGAANKVRTAHGANGSGGRTQ